MGTLEVIARMKIRPGQLAGFKAQAAELIRLTKEKDTQTARYDWYIDDAAMECEVHERYPSEAGLFEHNLHVMDARAALFDLYGSDHQMSFFGDVSPKLLELAKHHAGGARVFSFFRGLGDSAQS
jgi:quinol monooxygenase YgiN